MLQQRSGKGSVRTILFEFFPPAMRLLGDDPLELLRLLDGLGFTLRAHVTHGGKAWTLLHSAGAFRAWCGGGARDDDAGARLWAQLAEAWQLRKEPTGAWERENEERTFGSALRAFCAMEDSSAFEPGFAWPQLPVPPAMPP